MAEPPRWLTRAFSLLERDDLQVDLRQLHTLQKARVFPCCMHDYLSRFGKASTPAGQSIDHID